MAAYRAHDDAGFRPDMRCVLPTPWTEDALHVQRFRPSVRIGPDMTFSTRRSAGGYEGVFRLHLLFRIACGYRCSRVLSSGGGPKPFTNFATAVSSLGA